MHSNTTIHKQLTFHGKAVDTQVSSVAVSQAETLVTPLIIEIQIYFSCLLGKRLAFYSDQPINGVWQVEHKQFADMLNDAEQLFDNVYIRFNTVMTKACSVSDYAGPPPVTDFTIKNQKPYVPSWLNIDYVDELWVGEYGWPSSDKGFGNTRQVRAQARLADQ